MRYHLTDYEMECWRRQENFMPPPRRKDGTPGARRVLDRAGIINDYNAGMNIHDVAKKYSTTTGVISNIMMGNKSIYRQVRDADRELWGKIGALHRAKWSIEKIAADVWMDPKAVRIILRRMKEKEYRG